MNILWITWKDRNIPLAGGAEVLNEEHAKRLVKDGHTVIFLVGGYKNCIPKEKINGYTVIRVGNRFSVYLKVAEYYLKNLKGWEDITIEEINTVPFMTQWYIRSKRILYIYQLCREIWFHEIFFPINALGYVVEPIYLWLLRRNTVFTESQSTKSDLEKYDFNRSKIKIISAGIDPATRSASIKNRTPTILSVGSIRSMKRTLDQIKAFELAKNNMPQLQMKIAGAAEGKYGRKVLRYISRSEYADSIEYLGRVTQAKKQSLMQKAHLITVTSVKEGWGLIVTEAAQLGTPAVVYNADGLRDSVRNEKQELYVKRIRRKELSKNILKLLNDKKHYKIIQKNAIKFSNEFTFDKAYAELRKT